MLNRRAAAPVLFAFFSACGAPGPSSTTPPTPTATAAVPAAPDEPVAVLQVGHAFEVGSIAWHPSGKWVATRSSSSVRIWDVAAKSLAASIDFVESSQGERMQWDPAGDVLAIVGSSAIAIWDAHKDHLDRSFACQNDRRDAVVAWSPDGAVLVSTCFAPSFDLVAWEPRRGKEKWRLHDHAIEQVAPAFSADGTWVLVLATRRRVELLRASDGAVVRAIPFDEDVTTFGWFGKTVFVTGDTRGQVKLWDAAARDAPTATLSGLGWVGAIAPHPDGDRIAISAGDMNTPSRIKVLDRAGKQVDEYAAGVFDTLHWSKAGDRLGGTERDAAVVVSIGAGFEPMGDEDEEGEDKGGKGGSGRRHRSRKVPTRRFGCQGGCGNQPAGVSPDLTVAASVVDSSLTFWDVATAKASWTLPHGVGEPRVQTPRAGTRLQQATGDRRSTTVVVDLDKGTCAVRAGELGLLSADGSVEVKNDWRTSSLTVLDAAGAVRGTFPMPKEVASSHSWYPSPDGRWVAAFGHSGAKDALFLLDASKGALARTLPDVRANDVHWSPDGASLLVFGPKPDGRLVIDVKSGTTREVQGMKWQTSWSPDGRWILADTTLWSTSTWKVSVDVGFQAARTTSERESPWSPDGARLALHFGASSGTSVKIWNVAKGAVEASLGDPELFPRPTDAFRVAWSPDGRFLMMGDWDALAVYEANSWKRVRTLRGLAGEPGDEFFWCARSACFGIAGPTIHLVRMSDGAEMDLLAGKPEQGCVAVRNARGAPALYDASDAALSLLRIRSGHDLASELAPAERFPKLRRAGLFAEFLAGR